VRRESILDSPPPDDRGLRAERPGRTGTPRHGITVVKELRNTHTTRCSQTSKITNEIREERDQNSTDTTDGITVVRYFRDILPFHDRFLQQLGDRHRWVLYNVSFSDSPDQQFDTACDRTWTKEVGPQEITRLNKVVFRILQETFQDFAPALPIFWCHRVEHPLSASRVCFSLRDRFRVFGSEEKQPPRRALHQQLTEQTKTGNRTSQPPVYNTSTRILYNRHKTQNNTPHTSHKDTPRPHTGVTAYIHTRNTSRRHPHVHGQSYTRIPPPYTNKSYTVTTTDKRHDGVFRSKFTFKERLERFTDYPSDRQCITHQFTRPQSPTPKRLSPLYGMKSNGKRAKKSDGVIPEPIHPLGSPPPLYTSHPILGCPQLRGGGN
jgi:hypothetical protein